MNVSKEVLEDWCNELMKAFEYSHLTGSLQETSKKFHDLAHDLYSPAFVNVQTYWCLFNLLQAKDAAVRSML